MENSEEEIVVIEQVDMSIVEASERASLDTQIVTAKKYPRVTRRCIDDAIAIVTMDRDTASTCTYSVPRGGKAITGPSVHLAKILAQVWGNMRCEAKVIGIDERQITSQAIAFDLQSNLAIKVEVKRSIMTKNGRMNDDMLSVVGNAANSIALRNAILSVIPRAIVDKVYNEAKHTITGDISDESKFIARRKQVFDGLINTYGVTEQEALSAVGKSAIGQIVSDDLVVLIGAAQAIKDGDTTVELAFKNKTAGKVVSTITDDVLKDWQIQINDCTTEEMLTNLRKNSNEKRPQIIAMFIEREKQLKESK